MRLLWLADTLRDAGLEVVEEPGWRTRGRDWNPIGAMQHHTAPPVPYSVTALYPTRPWEWRIKCNLYTTTTGRVHVIAAGRTNYSSGPGSSVVLRETMADIAPINSARIRHLSDNTNMNLYYINLESNHAGDGSALPQVHHDAIVALWSAIFDRMDWSPNRLIAHAESTYRKVDPYWNGRNAHDNLTILRNELAGTMPIVEDPMLTPFYLYDGYTDPPPGSLGRTRKRSDVMILQSYLNVEPDGWYGPDTKSRVADLCGTTGDEVNGVDWVKIEAAYLARLTKFKRHLSYGDDMRVRRVPSDP